MTERKNDRTEILEINVKKLLQSFLHRWWLIVAVAVVFGIGAIFYTSQFITPMYRASVTIYVNNIGETEKIDYLSDSNLNASARLVNTYINIVTSNRVLEKVKESLQSTGSQYTIADLRKMLSASQVDDTEIFQVTITNPDPYEAAHVANAVAEAVPEQITGVIEGSSARIIDYAEVPTGYFTPSYRRNAALGAACGVVLVCAWLTVRHLQDVRIKDSEDLAELLDYPVLGQVPDYGKLTEHRGYAYGYSSGKEVKK